MNNNVFKNVLLIWTLSLFGLHCSPSYCPRYCQCDLYKNLNRAICSAQKLINPSIEIPKTVEILDLSENAITTLDNNCFEGFVHILNLTLSYNNIHTIYLDAFSPLERIQFIDLSNNRLEYFDQRIFENNKKLFSLNLSGNKFMSLQNKPILKSTSLQYLSLKNSQITHIYTNVFDELPSLLKIDISDNLLITLTSTPFNQLQRLKFVDLQRNRWICDKNIEATVKILKRKNVDVRMDKCNFDERRPKQKFERMMLTPKETTTERSETNVEFVWKNSNLLNTTNEEKCSRNDPEKACRLYEKCLTTYKDLLHKSNTKDNSTLIYFQPRLNIDFVMGLTIGVLAISLAVLCIYFIKKMCSRRKTAQYTYRYITNPNSRGRHQGRARQPVSTITPPRIPSAVNRSLSTPEGRTSDTNREDFAAFISGLFERPRRRQYCRAINQSTADVIRRLSRSNLLIGSRLSQHFAENRNPHEDTEHLIETNDVTSSQSSENNRQISQRAANMVLNRPETPPPAYKDVISTRFR